MPARVLMADDHQLVREGFRAILERADFEIVGEARDGWEAVRLARKHRPEVVVMDLSMPLLNGTDAAREILTTAPGTAIILLTVHIEEHYIVAALRSGVRGYVVKTQAAAELLAAIPEVLSGGTVPIPESRAHLFMPTSPATARRPIRSPRASGRSCSWSRKGNPRKNRGHSRSDGEDRGLLPVARHEQARYSQHRRPRALCPAPRAGRTGGPVLLLAPDGCCA